jgi:hypothetical protein
MTGGYQGVMEAASKGAAEAGGHVIGVTTAQIENQLPDVRANPWVKEEIKHSFLRDRLLYMVRAASGFIAMPGGVGTLHEIAETWELMRLAGIPRHPLICYGDYWQGIIGQIKAGRYVDASYRELVHFAHSPEDVLHILANGRKV